MKKSYRIKKEREFQSIIEQRESYANRNFVVYIEETAENDHFRVGLSVGKKVGNAVERNHVKRLIREALHDIRDEVLPQRNIILIARPKAADLSLEELKKNVVHVFKLANLIK